jgi:preprotein translocase subunit SecG
MYFFLLMVLLLDGLFLGVVILLQSGKGGGLAAMGGGVSATEGVLAGRQAATVLTRATWTAGGLFMGLSLVLAILSSRALQPQSILMDEVQQTAPAPAPILPGLTETPSGGEQTGDPGGDVPPTSGRSGGDPGGG